MLAVIGADGNLSVYDAAGRNPIAVTTDAVAGQRVYQWPTWSTDGRLAFFGASADPVNAFSMAVFVVETIEAAPKIRQAYTSKDDIFTYAYWSPGDCTPSGSATPHAGTTCRDLAVLYTPATQDGLALRLVRDVGGRFSDRVVGQASPFYYSFAPGGDRMLWYQNSETLKIYDVAQNKIADTFDEIPGKFQAPMWSPIDDRLLFGAASANPEQTDVVIAEQGNRRILLDGLTGPVSFAWSPDGTRVASVSDYGAVVVTDAASGKTLATGSQSNVVAHFWAPQSDRVAYLIVNRETPGSSAKLRSNGHRPAEQAPGGLTWYVLDVKSGQDEAVATFSPSRDMIYLLNFFDQFARSHRLWSPDGRYLTYGATDVTGKPNVMIVDTRQASSPVKVGAGTIGIWNYGD